MTQNNDNNFPQPPEGLGPAGQQLWDSITGTFDFRDEPGKLAILERACRTTDLIAKLEAEAEHEPMTAKGSMGQLVIHPYIAEIRSQTTVLNQLLKSLQLPENDEEAVAKAERRSNAGKKAAKARWGGEK